MRPLLGTFVEVTAHAHSDEQANAALAAAFARIEQAHALWSFHDPASELSRLNGAAGVPVALTPVTVRLLRLARALTRRSGGLFNCTVGGALVLQGVLPDHGGGLLPDHGRFMLAAGCADDIDLFPGGAMLRRPVRITLDGIAKGYAIDLALSAMRRAGALAGSINAGGDVAAFGDITVALQRRELDGQLTPLGALRNAALASSRVGARDDDFPACLIGPAGHAPAPGIWSVMARSAWRADALTKVAANAPAATRAQLVRELGGALILPPVIPPGCSPVFPPQSTLSPESACA